MVNVNFENGMMNTGDFTRIKKAMGKAMRGEEITVGFLGGSITQGCLSSVHETCYAYLVYKWWQENFPKAKIDYVNAGIGGTPSNFGVARVDDDLLHFNPDFSVVEFSVNDENTYYYMETYESLVRHILKDSSDTGLMLVSNVKYDDMGSAEDKHLVIGKYYGLPHVSMKHSVYPEVANGNIANREITPDDLHPNDLGHRLLADLIIHMLEKIKAEAAEADADTVISHELRKPITANGYENSRRLQNRNYKAKLEGFAEDHTPQENILQMFRYGYTAWNKGDRISFEAECSSISVQFRKSVNKPTPIARVVVDHNFAGAKVLDGNFDEDWGDCLYTLQVMDHGELCAHHIEIEIIQDHSEEAVKDVVPFYLVSVIAAN